jgi:hypothetical protein
MANYAVIQNNKVVNVIVADSKEIAEEVTNLTCIEYAADSNVGIGWKYDGTNLVLPVIEETPSE